MKKNKQIIKCTCYDDGVMCVWGENCPLHPKPKSIYEKIEVHEMKNNNLDDFTSGFGVSSMPSGEHVGEIKKLLIKEFMSGVFVGHNAEINKTKIKLAINKAIINLYDYMNDVELD
jgi:hypothetical protein